METTAIIQFIGIVLFSSAVTNDPGVHAILPRIDHAVHAHPIVESKTDIAGIGEPLNYGDTKVQLESDEMLEGVEDHVAVILFRKSDVLGNAGMWKRSGVLSNDWQFVELDGEQIQFLANGVNVTPSVPADLPRAAATLEECPVAAEKPVGLKDAFQAPDYAGAAAVVDIPLGTLDVCAKKTEDGTGLLRVDTTLLMQSEGVVVIAARKAGETAKTITLDGDAVVYVANVPPKYVFEGTYATIGEPHWQAYNDMLDTPCPSQPSTPEVATVCDLSAINSAWRQAQLEPLTPTIMMVDSECSNSQWP